MPLFVSWETGSLAHRLQGYVVPECALLRNGILISSNRSRDFIHISFDFVHFGMEVFY